MSRDGKCLLMDATGWNGDSGGSCLENLRGFGTLLQEREFGDEVVVSEIRTNTDIFTVFATVAI